MEDTLLLEPSLKLEAVLAYAQADPSSGGSRTPAHCPKKAGSSIGPRRPMFTYEGLTIRRTRSHAPITTFSSSHRSSLPWQASIEARSPAGCHREEEVRRPGITTRAEVKKAYYALEVLKTPVYAREKLVQLLLLPKRRGSGRAA
jgi:hypothetical protein